MSAAGEFYSAQANICAEAAQASDLPMLRQKYEAAGAAWEALARRESEIALAREKRLAALAVKTALEQGTPG